MGIFGSEAFVPGSHPGGSVSSSSFPRFSGPSPSWLAFALAALLLPLSVLGQTTLSQSAVSANYGELSLSFEDNQGQSVSQVKFLAHGQGYELFLTDRAAVLAFSKSENAPSKQNRGKDGRASQITARAVKTDVVQMELAGASSGLQVTGAERLPGKANYFIGSDPAKWHADIPTYAKVKYASVYPGVDLVFYGNQHQLEYDFVIAAGADPKPVRLHFAGAKRLKVMANGDLMVVARNGELAFHKPVVYQLKDGKCEAIEGRFELLAKSNVAFAIGNYDHGRQLVIDPTLVYSTYLGGSGIGPSPLGDNANGIAADSFGDTYIAGVTFSPDFPVTSGSFQTVYKGSRVEFQPDLVSSAFVTKINAAGTAILYSTFLGGSGNLGHGVTGPGDGANAIAVDSNGNAYITGSAGSINFPVTSGAFRRANTAKSNYTTNAFITKLNPTGSSLVYSTYLGGSGIPGSYNFPFNGPFGDSGSAIAVDTDGDAYVAGIAFSADFPLSRDAVQKINGAANNQSSNGFVAKLNAQGSDLVYSTYLGGSQGTRNDSPSDSANGIAVDGDGNAYVTGTAVTTDFPVTGGAFQQLNKCSGAFAQGIVPTGNAFVTKFNPAGSELVYSTYLGGSGTADTYGERLCDTGTAIALDSFRNAYITGSTASLDFPVTGGAFQTVRHGAGILTNAFVTKLNTDGSELVYSTYLGGSGTAGNPTFIVNDIGNAIAVDTAGDAYVAGSTGSYDFPITIDAFQRVNRNTVLEGSNAFLSSLNPTGSLLNYSTYLGGSGIWTAVLDDIVGTGDQAYGIAIDPLGNVHVAGSAYSIDFPITAQAVQPVNHSKNATNQAFVASFAANPSLIPTKTIVGTTADPARPGQLLTLTIAVKPLTGSTLPTGTVLLSIDGNAPISGSLDEKSALYRYSTSTLSEGPHSIQAIYTGDANYAASEGSLWQSVVGPPQRIVFFDEPPSVQTYGSQTLPGEFIAVVEDANGAPIPGVVVSFSGKGLRYSRTTAVTNTIGQVSVTVTPIAVGNLVGTLSVSNNVETTFPITSLPELLLVTARSISVPFGKPIPPLTYSIIGFVNGDHPSVVTGAPTESTAASQGSPAGTYPITVGQGTLAATNYRFQFENGTLTITPPE